MSTFGHTVTVDRPVHEVYELWSRFESHPDFMDGVEQVDAVSDRRSHWTVRVAGVEREYDAAVTRMRQDDLIEWNTVDGPTQHGSVSFTEVDDDATMVTLTVTFEPEGVTELLGDVSGVVAGSVERSLEGFREYAEAQPRAAGSP